MAEEIGLVVRVSIEGKKGSMERFKGEVAKSAEQGMSSGVSTGAKKFKLPPGLKAKLASWGGNGSGPGLIGKAKMPSFLGGASAGGASAALGTAASGVIVLQGIAKAVKEGVGYLAEASPMLRNQLRMLNIGFLQILRPLGDALSMMIRPISMFFRIIGREVIKRMRERRKELQAQGLSGAALGLALMNEMPGIYLDVIIEQLEKVDWSGMFAAIGETLWDLLVEKFPSFLEKLNSTGGMILLAILTAIGAMTILAGLGATIFATAVTAIGTMTVLGGLGGSIYATAVTAIGDMAVLAGLGALIFSVAAAWLYAQTPEGKGTVQDVFGVPDVQKPPTDPRVDTQIGYYNMSDVAGGDVWKPFKDVYNWLGFKGPIIPGLASGGEVASDGLIYAHRAEVVKDSGQIQSMIREAVSSAGGGVPSVAVTVNINGNVSKEIDLKRAIWDGIDEYYRTRVVNTR